MGSLMEFPTVKDKDKEFYVYKWNFEFYDVNNDKEKIHPTKVLEISKVSMYKEKVMPVLLADMRFNKADIVRLKRMIKSCVCDISCTCIVYNPTTNNGETTYQQIDTKPEFYGNFEPVFDINTFRNAKYNDDDTLTAEAEEKANIDKPSVLDSPTVVVHVSFFNTIAQKMMKTLYNEIIDSEVTPGSVIQWICSSACDETNATGFIIDKPANESDIGEVIIPTLNFIPALKYIQEMYGAYENGLMAFIDFDSILYILDKYADEHDRQKDDPVLTHIYVADADVTEAMSMTRSLNDNKEPMYIGIPLISNEDDEILKGEIVGNNFAFSSFNQAIDALGFDSNNEVDSSTAKDVAMVLKRNLPTHAATGEKTICDYDELNNVFNMASKFNELEAQAQRMNVTLQNMKLSDFPVNRFIELHFQNTNKNAEIGGIYYLNYAKFDFKELASAEIMPLSGDVEDTKFFYTKTSGSCTIGISRRNPVE